MRLFSTLASFSTGLVVSTIDAGRRLASQKKALAPDLTRLLEHTLMEISNELLALLRCPSTGQPLSIASKELLASINRKRANEPPLNAGLLREDGVVVYPIIDNLPVLLADAAISIAESGS